MTIHWQYYPRSDEPTPLALKVVAAFEQHLSEIDSNNHEKHSNQVLAELAPSLREIGFRVEAGKRASQKIKVPVLFGRQGVPEKSFDADAHHEGGGFVLEVEAGRGVTNNQFLKDLFQACMMHGVDYLAVAVRNVYGQGPRPNQDFETVLAFFDTLYASRRLSLPLKGILVIGY